MICTCVGECDDGGRRRVRTKPKVINAYVIRYMCHVGMVDFLFSQKSGLFRYYCILKEGTSSIMPLYILIDLYSMVT